MSSCTTPVRRKLNAQEEGYKKSNKIATGMYKTLNPDAEYAGMAVPRADRGRGF